MIKSLGVETTVVADVIDDKTVGITNDSNNDDNNNYIRNTSDKDISTNETEEVDDEEEIVEVDECIIRNQCDLCTPYLKETVSECSVTGRVITYQCGPRIELESYMSDIKDSNLAMIHVLSTASSNHDNSRTNTLGGGTIVDKNTNGTSSSIHTTYEICYRTESDDVFIFLRFQILVLLLGIWSYLNVRKQLSQHASLFDQRSRQSSTPTTTTSSSTTAATTTKTSTSPTQQSKSKTASASALRHKRRKNFNPVLIEMTSTTGQQQQQQLSTANSVSIQQNEETMSLISGSSGGHHDGSNLV